MFKIDCIGLKSGCGGLLSLLEVLGGNSLSCLFSFFQRLLPSSKSSVTVLSDLSSDTDPQPPASTSKDLVITFIAVVQSLSRVRLCDPMDCSTPGFPVLHYWSLLGLMSIESVMPSNHFIFCCPLLLLPSIFPSIRVFFKEFILYIRWPNHWSFIFSITPSNEYSGLISLGITLGTPRMAPYIKVSYLATLIPLLE